MRKEVLELQFNQVNKIDGFINYYLTWFLDSRFKITEEVTEFLNKQIRADNQTLQSIADKLKGKNPDETIINILNYVLKNITYRSDIGEQWYYATQILRRRNDDCDGMNSLIYVLARYAGIPSYNLYCGIVDTADPDDDLDHFTLFYWSTKSYDGKATYLYNIDATYQINTTPIKDRLPFQIDKNGIAKIFYLFNEEDSWKVKNS